MAISRPHLGLVGLLVAVACGTSDHGTPADGTTGNDRATDGSGSTGEAEGSTTGAAQTDTGEGEGESSSTGAGADDGPPPEPLVMTLMEDAVFYDGYAATVDEPVPPGLVRHSNAQYATRLSDEQRGLVQSTLKIGVIVGARCDNYDRIGSVHLALVPKGAETYVPEEVERIEVARFITPFMDMNESPMTVPYELAVDGLVAILHDDALWAEYDPWFELNIFGVPYAANTEIAGCEGRIDTQLGTLLLYTDSAYETETFDVLVPLAFREPFNNYAEGASDEIGTTRKTIEFELTEDAELAQLVLITSNHGANAGGEEYIRRDHFAYIDGDLALQYKPGRTTCEPFRMYNTQANGIYGPAPKSDAEWQSFSNWCPGDVIDIRTIAWGPVDAGVHEFVIDVPDATFAGAQGDFPLSLYLQAR